MASVSMAVPMQMTISAQNRVAPPPPSSAAFFNPLSVKQSKKAVLIKPTSAKFQVQASLKEKAITGLTAAALTASMVIPEVAQAAGSDVSPSLKNFLLSIVAGGVVLAGILGAIIGVSNFDPVKRS